MQDGIAQAALAYLARQLAKARVQACSKPVEALGQPVPAFLAKERRRTALVENMQLSEPNVR